MVKYVGLDKKDVLLKIQNDAITTTKNLIENYQKDIKTLLDAYKPTKSEKFWGAVSIVPSTLYSLFKGFMDGVINAGTALAITFENAWNDARHIFDDSDGTDAFTDIKYMFKNFGITLAEGMLTTATSTLANLGRIVGVDPKWAYGEGGAVEDIAKFATRTRGFSLNENDKSPRVLAGDSLFKKEVEERYYDETLDVMKGTVEVQKWISKNIVDNVANILTLDTKKYADNFYKDSGFYEFLQSSSESIGNILSAWALGGIGSKLGINAQALTTVYFASTVFGKSFQEASDNGASLQDAYTYALGTAFLETAIENIGGFTTSGVEKSAKKSIFENLLGEKWGNIVSNAIEEGLEEVGSEIAGTGLSYYNNEDNKIDAPEDFKEFASRIMFSYLGGAFSSFALGIGHNMYIDTTAVGKTRKVVSSLGQKINQDNSGRALKRFQKDLDVFVEYINKENARGLKEKKGQQYMGQLSQQEKKKLVYEMGLSPLIEEVEGKFQVREKAREMGEKIFQNRIGEEVISSGEYAVNDLVWGVDISDDGTINVTKTKDLNKRGEKIFEIAKKRNVPLAVMDLNQKVSAVYGNNGVIYINQNETAEMTDAEIESIIIKHELVHHIAKNNPAVFSKLKKLIDNFVEFKFDKETKTGEITYKNKAIEDILEKKGYKKVLIESFIDDLDAFNDSDIAIERTEEEMVAYFVEDILEGGEFIDIISKNDPSSLNELQKATENAIDEIGEKDKKTAKKLKKVRNFFEKATKKILIQKRTLGTLLENFFGIEMHAEDMIAQEMTNEFLEKIIDEELLEKYSVQDIMDAVFEAADNDPDYTEVIIEGQTFALDKVFSRLAQNLGKTQPKRLAYPNWDDIWDKFKFDEKKRKIYIDILENFDKENRKDADSGLLEGKYLEQMNEMIDLTEDAIDKLKNKEELSEEELNILREAVTNVELKAAEKAWKKENQRTMDTTKFKVLKSLIRKVVLFMNDPDISGINGWRNRAQSINYNAAYLELDKKNKAEGETDTEFAARIQKNIHWVLQSKFPKQYIVRYSILKESPFIEFLIKVDTDFLDKEVEKADAKELRLQEERKYEDLPKTKEAVKTSAEDSKMALEKIGISLENKNVIDISELSLEELEKIEFDENNVIVGNPDFSLKKEGEYIKASFKVAPIVAIVLPRPWVKSYQKQQEIYGDKKVIHNELIPLKSYKTNIGNRRMKTVVQVWVNGNDVNYKNYKNLRAVSRPQMKHYDFNTTTLNGIESKYIKAKYEDFDFAVLYESNTENFNNLITNFEDLNPKGHYLLIKTYDKESLEILKSIDYEKLADEGSTLFRGFTTYDLVEAYKQKKKEKSQMKRLERAESTTGMKRQSRTLTNEQKEFLGGVSEYFEVNGKGKFVVKSEFLPEQKPLSKQERAIQFGNKIYTAEEYAVHTNFNFSQNNIVTKEKIKILKLSELSDREEIIYDFFKASKLNFVLYHGRTKFWGFSSSMIESNVVFINTKNLTDSSSSEKMITDTFIHETIHEMFKKIPNKMVEFSKGLKDILFNSKGEPTWVYKTIDHETEGFIEYLKSSYKKLGYKFKTPLDVYMFLENASMFNLHQLNEFTAQVVGYIFADNEIYKYVFKGTSDSVIAFHKIYKEVMESPSISPIIRHQLQKSTVELETLFKEYFSKLAQEFPLKKAYTLADLNKFIKSFTKGKFSSRSSLIQAFLKEQANHKKGEATKTLNNIIYIASIFAETSQRNYETYQKLVNEFKEFQVNIDLLLNQEEDLFKVQRGDLLDLLKVIVDNERILKKIPDDQAEYREEILINLQDDILEFAEIYEDIPNEFLNLFKLPSKEVIRQLVLEVSQKKKTMADFVNFIKKIKKQIADFEGIYKQIADLVTAYRKKQMDLLVVQLKDKFKATTREIFGVKPQSKSMPTEILREVLAIVGGGKFQGINYIGIINAIENNEFNLKYLAEEIVPLIKRLNALVALHPGALSQEKVISEKFDILYAQLALLLKDVNILSEFYPSDHPMRNLTLEQLGKKFIPTRFANALMDIVKAFQTKYTNSLSKDTLTNDEYSEKTTKQIINFSRKLKDTNIKSVINVMPHQFVFSMYKDLLGDDIDFFKDFYNEYINAVMRRSDILAEYKKSYKEWVKNNKKLLEYSLQKVTVSKNFLLPLRKDILLSLQEDAKKEYNIIVEEYEAIRKEIKGKSVQIKGINNEIKEVKNKYKNNKISLEEKLKELKRKKKSLEAEIRQKRIEALDKKNNLGAEQLIKKIREKIFYYASDPKNNIVNQQIARGELISSYMSLNREIELEELANQEIGDLNPTNHFHFGNVLHFFDNELLWKKGYAVAKDNTTPFVIYAENKHDLREYLEGFLQEEDFKIIDFAKTRFNKNYEQLNEVYQQRYKSNLPKQENYIPFSSNESDYGRDIDLRVKNRRNLDVPDGFVMETTLGANTGLRIENIFGVIENHTRMVANWAGFDRLLDDWQNIYVNKSGGVPLQEHLAGKDNKFGANNSIVKAIETAFIDNLSFTDLTQTQAEKIANRVLQNSMAATMAVNLSSMIKQFASVLTVMVKHKLRPSAFIKNVMLSLGKSKYRNWLLKNNSNFYHRADAGNVPHLAEMANLGVYYIAKDKMRKITNALTAHIGWADNVVLVAAFKTIADEVRKSNPQMMEEEVLQKANEKFNEVLLFGVANTDPGFKAHLSNTRGIIPRYLSRFQSENIVHAAALYRGFVYLRNGIKGGFERFGRDIIAYLLSGLFAGIVSNSFGRIRGYYDDKEEANFDFWVNELLINNIIGGMPIVNFFTSMIQFETPKELEEGGKRKITKPGFEPKFPLATEAYEIIRNLSQLLEIYNDEGDNSIQFTEGYGKKIIKILENIGSILGFPIKNLNRLVSTTSYIFGQKGSKQLEEINRFYSSQTKAQAFGEAVKRNQRTRINMYVDEVYDDLRVRNEMTKILFNNPELKLSLYDAKYFRKDNIKYVLPQEVKEKYNALSQRSLSSLIRKGRYRRLSDEEKIRAMQRIINYYYNYMKSVVLKEKKKLLNTNEVVENALKYSE